MLFYFIVLLNLILCSFILFPIGFTFLPSAINTKIIMAIIGLIFVFRDTQSTLDISTRFFWLFIWGGVFSCVSLFSVLYNETTDYTYASYILSMSVWMSAAYVFVLSVSKVHQHATFRLVVNYLLAVCVLQCILALFIEYFYPLKNFVDATVRFVGIDIVVLNEIDRLYGLGAALDPAGVRFAVVLVLVSVILNGDEVMSSRSLIVYISSFLLVAGLGNLISRTTMIGASLGIAYLVLSSFFSDAHKEKRRCLIFCIVFILALLISCGGYWFYMNMEDMRILIKFGFEAFFNLVEEGEFTTDSTQILSTMWIFPDNFKTWIIGDGWFNDPFSRGFYKFTDIGYLRFIFYSGVLGLLIFTLFIFYVVKLLTELYPRYRAAFFLLFFLGLIIWIKVSTDLFQFYAIFIALSVCSSESGLKNKRCIC